MNISQSSIIRRRRMTTERLTKMNDEINYEAELEIDPDALDVEWLEQAARYMRWSKLSADARSKRDRAKEALEVTVATVAMKIRAKPETFGLVKVTEGGIQELITVDEDVRAAKENLLAAQHETDIMFAAVSSFEQRKSALENLVKLAGQGYFSTPQVPRDLPAAAAAHRKDAHAATAEVIKNRRAGRRQ